MKKILGLGFMLFALFASLEAKDESPVYVSAPVLGLYEKPDASLTYDSQLVYGTQVTVQEDVSDEWKKIAGEDNYSCYSQIDGLIERSTPYPENIEDKLVVSALFCNVYKWEHAGDPISDKIITTCPIHLTLPFGAVLEKKRAYDERWYEVILLDGSLAYINQRDVMSGSLKFSMDEVIQQGLKFVGLPYVWGGCSTYGYDCSGTVQTLFKKMGVILPRNASQQVNSDYLVDVASEDLVKGDLIFWKEKTKKRAGHVGIYLGDGKILHASASLSGIVVTDADFPEKVMGYERMSCKRLKAQ